MAIIHFILPRRHVLRFPCEIVENLWFSGGGLNYLFELMMLYRTANDIETRSYHLRSSDLAWQTLWACGGIIGATFPLRTFIFTRPLLLCLVYLYAALAPPGSTTSIMGLVTIPIVYYPYALIALDLVLGGPKAAAEAVAGAAVGHLWWWAVWGGGLASRGLLQTWGGAPAWMRTLMGEDLRPPPTPDALGGAAAGLARGGVHVSAPRPQAATANAAGGATTTGYSWGSGRRLGTS
ncbi:hypothetical protein D9619_010968 [Psilocybe cf. subviscida]|uniref:Derlin n=1 Tax=Psilocybe cf. subviscida TaxID=2480587 RepID=A0A8H5F071_9AGAR|nr:hypothetical protein D9619_010968 [Psilocybe cf. subviscida]